MRNIEKDIDDYLDHYDDYDTTDSTAYASGLNHFTQGPDHLDHGDIALYRNQGFGPQADHYNSQLAENTFRYQIKWGDTLTKIAQRYGVTVQQILALNRGITDPDLIYAGDSLKIPIQAASTEANSAVEFARDPSYTGIEQGTAQGMDKAFDTIPKTEKPIWQDIAKRPEASPYTPPNAIETTQGTAASDAPTLKPQTIQSPFSHNGIVPHDYVDMPGKGEISLGMTGRQQSADAFRQGVGEVSRIVNKTLRQKVPAVTQRRAVAPQSSSSDLSTTRLPKETHSKQSSPMTISPYADMSGEKILARLQEGVEAKSRPMGLRAAIGVRGSASENIAREAVRKSQDADQKIRHPALADIQEIRDLSRKVKYGDKGDTVKRLQILLGVADDGIYGKKTRSALIGHNQSPYVQIYARRGGAYKAREIKSYSHYYDPIKHKSGEPTGRSRRHGDADIATQAMAINAIIYYGRKYGMTDRDIAFTLATARTESGFNPDAASGESASGLGQFIDETGAKYGINSGNRWDMNTQAEALVRHTRDNMRRARMHGKKGIDLYRYTYKYHHDGPVRDYGGLTIADRSVLPRVRLYEKYLAMRKKRKNKKL